MKDMSILPCRPFIKRCLPKEKKNIIYPDLLMYYSSSVANHCIRSSHTTKTCGHRYRPASGRRRKRGLYQNSPKKIKEKRTKAVANVLFLWYNNYRKSCMASLWASPFPCKCTDCNIDGCVKMPLQASIFTYGII